MANILQCEASREKMTTVVLGALELTVPYYQGDTVHVGRKQQ